MADDDTPAEDTGRGSTTEPPAGLDGVIDELAPEHVYGNVYEACADRITESE